MILYDEWVCTACGLVDSPKKWMDGWMETSKKTHNAVRLTGNWWFLVLSKCENDVVWVLKSLRRCVRDPAKRLGGFVGDRGTLLSRSKLTRICICRTLEACSYLYHCIFLLHTLGHASYESELVIPLIILIYFTHWLSQRNGNTLICLETCSFVEDGYCRHSSRRFCFFPLTKRFVCRYCHRSTSS